MKNEIVRVRTRKVAWGGKVFVQEGGSMANRSIGSDPGWRRIQYRILLLYPKEERLAL
jgi:hypothetical protein